MGTTATPTLTDTDVTTDVSVTLTCIKLRAIHPPPPIGLKIDDNKSFGFVTNPKAVKWDFIQVLVTKAITPKKFVEFFKLKQKRQNTQKKKTDSLSKEKKKKKKKKKSDFFLKKKKKKKKKKK